MFNTIEFNGKQFTTRTIDTPTYGLVTIGTTNLNDLLLDEDGSYVSEQAKEIDEGIMYFVSESELNFPEETLLEIVENNI